MYHINFLLNFSGVEFWSDPFLNTSDVTFMLHPNQEKWVKKKLLRSNIPFKVSVSFSKYLLFFKTIIFQVKVADLQSEIERHFSKKDLKLKQT